MIREGFSYLIFVSQTGDILFTGKALNLCLEIFLKLLAPFSHVIRGVLLIKDSRVVESPKLAGVEYEVHDFCGILHVEGVVQLSSGLHAGPKFREVGLCGLDVIS